MAQAPGCRLKALRTAAGSDYRGAHAFTDLDRRAAYVAGRAMHQQYVPCLQACAAGEGEVSGPVRNREGGGGRKAHPFWHLHDVSLGNHDLLSVSPVR